jgi:hypothetical protein
VTERATVQLAAPYAPGLTMLDEAAGHVDELVSAFSLEVARESAWEGAVALANARNAAERAVTMRLQSARASVIARLLRAPSRSPSFVRAALVLEQRGWIGITTSCFGLGSG